jgi:hypothetical protein
MAAAREAANDRKSLMDSSTESNDESLERFPSDQGQASLHDQLQDQLQLPEAAVGQHISVLDDSLLVDQEEVLHEIPVTPIKARRPSQLDGIPQYLLMEAIPEEHYSKELQIGDHVYQWRSWAGIPAVFQHHGIVMDIQTVQETDDKDNVTTSNRLTIADFSNKPIDSSSKRAVATTGTTNSTKINEQEIQNSTSGSSPPNDESIIIRPDPKRLFSLEQGGILQAYTDTDSWHKVHYEAPWWKRQVFSRAGTCTHSKSDAVGIVLARVHFILENPDILPDYHVIYANCECVAYWCKTGHWSTLQAASFLEYTAAGQAKSTGTMAAAAVHSQVSVPAAGLWGWLGYTTKVSLLSVQPMLIPALAGYGIVTVGAPAIIWIKARKQWEATSKKLSDAFWESAMERPQVFAECMTHWSDKVG